MGKGLGFRKPPEADASALIKTAHELHDKVNEFEALLAKTGDKTDAALRERLKTICTGLASIVTHKTPQEPVDAGQVEFHLEANMLRGSVGSFRDAHVDFEDMYINIHAFDCGGNAWTSRSTKLPGPIIKEECRFMVSKTGKDLRVTLKKATADATWHGGNIKFCEQACTRSACSSCQRSTVIINGLKTSAARAASSRTRGVRNASSSAQSSNVSITFPGHLQTLE